MIGYHFKLIAQQYRSRDLYCQAPFEITLPEGDPRLPQFRNHSFKENAANLPDDFGKTRIPDEAAKSPEEPTTGGEGGEASIKDIPLGKIEGITPDVVKQLKKAGYSTAQAVVAITPETFDLTTLEGVGQATATKIVKACQDAIEAAAKSPEEPTTGGENANG